MTLNTFTQNVKKFLGSKENWKKVGWGTVGAVGGELIPAAVQGISGTDEAGNYNIDLAGWKGDMLGAGTMTILGAGFGKKEVAYGVLSAKALKRVYIHGNEQIANLFGSPLVPGGDQNLVEGVGDDYEAPAGMRYITRPDGSKVLVSSGDNGEVFNQEQQGEPQGESQSLNDYSNVPLNTEKPKLTEGRYKNEPLSDFTNQPFEEATGMADFDQFAENIASGQFN